ncbi:MAG: DAK2 domain-containing protein [Chloroflexi bacterium]|nr:DAK2 domain-containing protein [Chloroflexota bacterium]
MSTEAPPEERGYRGEGLIGALRYAAAWLDHHAPAIDALNVYPVPDGDTGLNMSVTLRAALAAAEEADATLAAVAQAAARGALMGARGNSGVILSQLLRGFADTLGEAAELTPALLGAGLAHAAHAAYCAVLRPVEGTMLTVAREAGRAAGDAVARGAPLLGVLEAAVDAAEEAVQRTPEQLDVLREAGVVDAGGQGYAVLLAGLLRGLRGESPEAVPRPVAVAQRPLHLPGEEAYGYCTEFVILGPGLDLAAVRDGMARLGQSVLVVGDESALRVHLHALDPGPALSYAVERGALTRVKIENMDEQQAALGRQPVGSRVAAPATAEAALPIVAAVAGEGFAELYRSLGATCVVTGARGTNPSVAELAAAISATAGREVFVLPNDPNVAPAVEQAARQVEQAVTALPTRDMAQGLAALLAYSPLSTVEDNAAAMRAALDRVRTARVTWAARDAVVGGVALPAGTALALADRRLLAHGADVAQVVMQALAALGADGAELITLYVGRELPEADRRALAERVRVRWPQSAVEVVPGRQPNDYYLLAVE